MFSDPITKVGRYFLKKFQNNFSRRIVFRKEEMLMETAYINVGIEQAEDFGSGKYIICF